MVTAGNSSAFRKLFPKIEEGAPVSCIADIPAVTNATYTLTNTVGGGESKTGPLTVVAPDNSRSDGSSAHVYFPHLGSVYDYFLKGIQTALRPQGYGEPITNGQCTPQVACGEWESKLTDTGGACGICGAPIGDLANKILTAAGTAYNVPASNIWAAMLHEGGDWEEFGGFTDEDVRKWSNSVACGGEPMPRCDDSIQTTQAPFGFLKNFFDKDAGNDTLWSSVQKIDPSRNSRNKVSRCNFLDAAFAAANLLSQGSTAAANGIMSCGSHTFDNSRPGTCTSAYWTGSRVAQSQVVYMGQCPDVGNYEKVPYTISDVVGWEKAARCQ